MIFFLFHASTVTYSIGCKSVYAIKKQTKSPEKLCRSECNVSLTNICWNYVEWKNKYFGTYKKLLFDSQRFMRKKRILKNLCFTRNCLRLVLCNPFLSEIFMVYVCYVCKFINFERHVIMLWFIKVIVIPNSTYYIISRNIKLIWLI